MSDLFNKAKELLSKDFENKKEEDFLVNQLLMKKKEFVLWRK